MRDTVDRGWNVRDTVDRGWNVRNTVDRGQNVRDTVERGWEWLIHFSHGKTSPCIIQLFK